jgi:hypothetical protein
MPCGVSLGAWLAIRKALVLGKPHPLGDALAVARQNAQAHRDKADADTRLVAETMLASATVRMSSQACFADRLQVSRFVLARRQTTLAAASFVASRHAKWSLETLLRGARHLVDGIAYVECARYDETPMRVRSAGQSSAYLTPYANLPTLPSTDALVPTDHAWGPGSGELATTSSSAGKILQPEVSHGLFLKRSDRFFGIVGSRVCHLQLLERNTTRCLLSAQMSLSAATPDCAVFKHRLRLSTTDRHSSNLACERELSRSLGDNNFSVLHQTCDIHVVARIHTRVFSMVEEHITGILRRSLSLSVSA